MKYEYSIIYSIVLGIITYFYLYLDQNYEEPENKSVSIKIPMMISLISFIILIYFLEDYDTNIISQNNLKINSQEILLEDFY